MRLADLTRTFAVAVLAAGLSFGGPGAVTLGQDVGGLAREAGEGHGAPPFVARHDATPPRLALQRGGADGARLERSSWAVLPGRAPALAAAARWFVDADRPAHSAPGRLLGSVRTSRGPPIG